MTALTGKWYSPTAATPDFYNSEHSTFLDGLPVKKARSGQGRIGLILNSRNGVANEYAQVRLLSPLKKNRLYCVTVHYSLDKRCDYYAEHIGVCFTQEIMTSKRTGSLFRYGMEDNVLLMGNDTLNKNKTGWQSYSMVYESTGDEQYMTIGCFEPSYALDVTDDDPAHYPMKGKGIFSTLAYYYIDDISVVELEGGNGCNKPVSEKPSLNHFVFVLDASASMEKSGYLEEMKRYLLQLSDSLSPADLVSVFRFDLRTQIVLSNVAAGEKNILGEALRNLRPGNLTNVDKAITVAYDYIDSLALMRENTRLILVSDARFSLSKQSRETILDHTRLKNIGFSMVQYGPQVNRPLQRTVTKARGIYIQAGSSAVMSLLGSQVIKAETGEYTPALNRSENVFRFFDIE